MLITIRDVIETAYITNIDEALIKEAFIDTAEKTWIKPVLSETLYTDVTNNPGSYTALIDDYIKPCLSFYVKYLIYTQQLFATAEYSSPDPTKADKLIDPATAALIPCEVNQSIINDILFTARQKEMILIDHLNNTDYQYYEKTTKKRISGFLIKTPSEES